ncbi:MAG: domain S-box protein [Phycisphaerales bacterium]|nr:domain S-box protein [Phycisphaerales bacterium]
MREKPRHALVAHGLAFLAVAASLLFRWIFWPVFGDAVPFMGFFPAVMVAAYLGGAWPGMLATLLSAAAASFFLFEPRFSFAIADRAGLAGLVLFLLTSTMICILSEAMYRAQRRLLAQERQRANEALRENEERFRQLAENIHEIFWIRDAKDGELIYLSPGYEDIWGRTVQSLHDSPDSALESIHPDDRDKARQRMEQQRRGESTDAELRIVRPDGSIRWIRSRGFPIKDQDGGLSRTAGLAEDITQRKEIEHSLRQSEARLHRMLDSLPAAAYTCDADGLITYFNERAAEVWGRSPKLNHPDDRYCGSFRLFDVEGKLIPHDQCGMAVAMREKREIKGIEVVIERADGSRRNVLAHISPTWGSEGQIAGAVNVVVDITDRKRTEKALKESEERFRTLAKATNDAVWDWDLDTNKVWWSEGIFTLFGHVLEQGSAEPAWWLERVHPDDRRAVEAFFFDVVRGRELSWVDEYRFRSADGSYKDVYDRGYVIRDGDGRAIRMIGAMLDITARKRAEESLRESEERFRGTFENAAVGIANIDFEGRWLRVNQRLCDIVGRTREELLQTTFQEITYPDDLSVSFEQFTPFTRGERNDYAYQKRYVRKDGSLVWVEIFGTLQRDAAGKPAYAIAMIQDISERKRLEQELRESEHRWRSLTEALPQLVWTATPDGACDYFSTQWTDHTGVPERGLLGWSWLETLHPDDRKATQQAWTAAIQGPGAYDVEYRVRRSDGAYRWFKTRGAPIRDSAGGIFKWFGTCTDITDAKTAEEELRLAKEAAESANRAKDEFLANVSHEIRTPMNAILGLTTLVLGTRLNDGQRHSLTTVKSAANNLLGIINDLLDFSKIEAGKLELDATDFSLRAALGDTLRALAIRAHQKGLELASNVQPDVPDYLVGDAGRLRQVLLNLVGNAIKFTEKGEVVVEVNTDADTPSVNGDVHLLFTVRDTGIGIPRDKQATIFRAFEQEDSSTTRKYGGTGLGLTIAAQLAELMGGKITVESEPGRGSLFSITTRFGRSSKREALIGAIRSPDPLNDLRVLIVDDNFTNRHILEEWLQNWRMRPVAVGDGAAALDAVRSAAAAGTPYPLVLLDGRMPDTDGLTLAGEMRQRVDVSSSTRIVLLSSDDRTINIARSREMGISAHLLKPVQQSELLEAIRNVMSRTTEETAPATTAGPTQVADRAPPVPATPPLRILVAEDNEFNVTLLNELFALRGHHVHVAGDGREALALAMGGAFDLLLLDIHMPEMDGFEVVQAIRERERTTGRHLPVIAFTARSGKTDRERCLAAGMDDFLSKPIQADALWAVIDRNVAAHPAKDNPDLSLFDPEAILRACGGDAGILEKICQTFRTSVPRQVGQVRAALRDEDAARLREVAHTLCSTLAAFSSVAGTVASDLEDKAERRQIDQCIPLVERLESICSQLVEQAHNLSVESLSH